MKEFHSLDDVFNDDDMGLLDVNSEDERILYLQNVPHKSLIRAEADEIARRKQCDDFDLYEPLFKKVHVEIKEGKRKLLPFNDKGEQLVQGQFYLLDGVMAYIAEITITSEEKTIDGQRFRKDGRTRTIFENGTESNLLYRSLAKALYKNGRIITETSDETHSAFYRNFSGVKEEDHATGFIYVLKSLSSDSRIASLDNLYKIGFSTTKVEKRIAGARHEPTYLMADVALVREYHAYNINVHRFERCLHAFFAHVCLDLEVSDGLGINHRPREWFIAPLDIIEKAIQLLVDNQLQYYLYDAKTKSIVFRD